MSVPTLTAASLFERLAFETKAPARTPVSLEFDPAYEAGKTLFDYLVSNIEACEVVRKALGESGGAGTDTAFVDPIFSPRATVEDLAFFKENPSRKHRVREAITVEPVLAARSPASDFIVCVRHIQRGVRKLLAIPVALLIIDPATRPARLDDDEILAMLFETPTRAVPGHCIYIDKILTYFDEMRSAAAIAESDSKRRLS
jgi:hypothetical protein